MAQPPFIGSSSAHRSIWGPLSAFPGSVFDSSFPSPIFNDPLRHDPFGRDGLMAITGTRVDWVETTAVHIIKVDLPGLKKEDIKVEVVDGRVLSISGERRKEFKIQEADSLRCVERSYGKFFRRFDLPDNAKTEDMTATMENGVLTVTLPKARTELPHVRAVEIS